MITFATSLAVTFLAAHISWIKVMNARTKCRKD